jgi:hypothetical protein
VIKIISGSWTSHKKMIPGLLAQSWKEDPWVVESTSHGMMHGLLVVMKI